jgi:hypothetical protein
MYSRPKRAAALAAVAAINDEQKTEKRQRTENADDSDSDNGDYDPSVPLISQSDNHKQNEPTLRDLIQTPGWMSQRDSTLILQRPPLAIFTLRSSFIFLWFQNT